MEAPLDSDSQSTKPQRTWAIRIVTLRGIPIRVHLTFLLLIGFLYWWASSRHGFRMAALELLFVLLLFVCVALHELGHAVAARSQGIPISDITLHPFGGMTRLARRPQRPMAELLMAVAGPAVNLVIAALIAGLSGGTIFAPGRNVMLHLTAGLFWANLIIAGFNLLPAFPLDGGRILRSALAGRLGWCRATIWAASFGQILAFCLIFAGFFHSPWLILAGVLILPGASAELQRAQTLRELRSTKVGDVMITHIEPVSADTPLEHMAAFSRHEPLLEYPVTDEGRVIGYLSAARLWAALRSANSAGVARDAMLPVSPEITTDTPLGNALEILRHATAQAAPIVTTTGELVGMVTLAGLERSHQLQLLAGEDLDPGGER